VVTFNWTIEYAAVDILQCLQGTINLNSLSLGQDLQPLDESVPRAGPDEQGTYLGTVELANYIRGNTN